MARYINKDTVVAEIERRIKTNKECMLGLKNLDYYQGKIDALNDTISFLDALESKEVDLEEEIRNWLQKHFEGIGYVLDGSGGWIGRTSLFDIAEHFFEMGINQ